MHVDLSVKNVPPITDALPLSDGRLAVAGLQSEVRIFRDAWSIPHIRARSSGDAFFAQGYVHAQDRLWQMDAARRRMQGRWSEWAGPEGIPGDALARRLNVAEASRRDYAALTAGARAMLEAYAAGVNACLGEARPLPMEYRLLGAEPEKWEPWHSIAVMRHRGFLMGSVWFKLWRAAALRTIGPAQLGKLRYDDDNGDLLCIPPGAQSQRWIATLQDLAPAIEALALLGAADATGGGSNNWALSPSRTASGRPLLAGDPHRAFELPSVYVQTHLACDAFDAIGLTIPGVPAFPHFAHNGHVAWCVTHAFVDIHDLFVERFDVDAAGARYLFKDQWLSAVTRTERIEVRGQRAVEVAAIETHHGPVVAGDAAKGSALTLRSVQFADTDRSFDCLLPMLQAHCVDRLFESTRGWGLIDHNLVAADTDGTIGHLIRATVPRRPRLNGWLPVPGWSGEYEWNGDIPWEEMPRVIDPQRGYLVTANNRVVSEDAAAKNYLCTDCHPSYRARRIEARLEGLTAASVDDMQSIHADDVSLTAAVFQSRIAALNIEDTDAVSPGKCITSWDRRMSADSIGAAAYSRFRWQLAAVLAQRSGLGRAANDPLTQVPPGVVPVNQLWWTLPALLRSDDTSLLAGWTWDQAIREALRLTALGFEAKPWGDIHAVRFAHPLAGLFPPATPSLNPAGHPVGGDNDTVFAAGCLSATGLSAVYGAVARYVFDVGAWQNCRWIVVSGASGQPESPHYMDQHKAWANCELVPMLYDWKTIASSSRCLTLEPADSALRARALKVIPGGMWGHMRAQGLPAGYPQYFSHARGCRLWDVNGREYIDFMCSWGPVVLGHQDADVDAAASAQQQRGDVMNGPGPVMVELAELLVRQIAHADWAMFAKNGTDATTIAVTSARAANGRRKVLVAQGAYHGSAPWCTPSLIGVTAEDRAHLIHYRFNDIESLDKAAREAGNDLAAVLVCAFRHDFGVDQALPTQEFAQAARRLCDREGAALILDEVRAGCRLDAAGSWEHLGVRPDLSAWSKAIANGHALAAVTGNERYRGAAGSIFVTGSFWCGATAMAAALATLKKLAAIDGVAHMRAMGMRLREGLAAQAGRHGIGIRQSGPAQMPLVLFDDDPDFARGSTFTQAALEHGVYLHPKHNMFLSVAHQPADIDLALEATDRAFAAVAASFS